jgi:hypothetical protein
MRPNLSQRRAFLGALAATAVPVPAAAASIATSRESADQSAAALTDAMARLHGGRWKAHIDHENGFILIRMLLGEREGGAA